MPDFKHLESPLLYDLLADYTAAYTKAFIHNTADPGELEKLNQEIVDIQAEISFRQWMENRAAKGQNGNPLGKDERP